MSKFKTIFLLLAFTMLANFSVVAQSPGGDPPAPFAVTGTGSYCTGGTGVAVGLAGSETGVTYTLYKGAVAQTPTVDGTGSAISFGNQLIGTYTVKGSSPLGTTDMTGTANVTLKPAFAISSQSTDTQTITYGGTFTSISVTATGSGLTYQWYSNSSASTTGGTSLGTDNGAQTNSYTPQANTIGTLYYYCIVNGDCGTLTSAVSGAFVVNQITQSISFNSLSSKTYGDASFTVSATGGASGNPVTFTSSDNNVATCTGTNGSTITIIAAGSCTIYANQAGNTNYSAAAQVGQTFTVDKKSLTVTADNKSKVYDGSVFSPFTVTYSGFISGESVGNLGGTLAYSGTATTATAVGTGYVITPSGLTSSNYAISFVNGTLDITKASQSITFGALSNKTYGDADFGPGGTSLTSGINAITYVSSNTAVATIVSGQIHIVGAGTTTITASQAASADYSAASDVSQSFTVDKKSLTVTADNKSKVYDGSVFSPFTVTYSGFISGESVGNLGGTLAYSGTATTATAVGTGYVITPSGLTSSNYAISFVNGTLDITKASQSITFGALSNKTYGDADFGPGGTSLTSGINAITYVSSNTAVATIVSGQIHIVGAGTTTITASQAASADYSAASDVSQSFTVDKKSLTVTADNKSKVYDGSVFSPFTVTYSGFISGESVGNLGGTLAYSGTATTATAVGIGYVITPSGLTSSNYAISFVNGTLDITKATQSITFGALSNKTYGDADFGPGATSVTSGINAITYVSSNTAVATIVSGQIHIVGAGTTTITASQAASADYSAASDVSQSFTVDKKSLTVTADNKSKVYDGSVFSPFTVTYSGFISGESVGNLGGTLAYSGTATTATAVGTGYVITPSGLTSSNYAISFVNGTLDITKATQSITFGALSNKTYGDADFGPGATSVTSGINAITYVSSNTAVATIVSGQIHIVGAGTTTITASQAASADYSAASDVSQSFTVDKKSLTVTADNKSKVYDGSVFSPFTVTYSGFISGESVGNLGGTLAYSGTATTATAVGTGYVITPSGLTSSNYAISFVNGTLDITKATQSITFGALSNKTYGDADFGPGATSVTSGINAITYVSSNTAVATIVSGQIHIVGAGTTTITASQAASADYSAASDVSQSFTVDKKSLTVTADNKSKVYDGSVFSPFTVTYSGFISGESVGNLGGTLAYSGTATTATAVGIGYVIIPEGVISSNYTITFVAGKLDITKKTLTITAEDKTKVYDGSVYSPFTVTYSGFATGDDTSSLGGTLVYNGTARVATNVGTNYTIIPSGLTSTNYDIDYVNGTLDITSKAQTITFDLLPTKTYNDPNFNLTATASSGLPVSYVSSNTSVATISGNTVTIVSAGSTDITASQSGNSNYTAATDVVRTLTVGKANQVLTLSPLPVGTLPLKDFNSTPVQVTAISSSGLPVSISLGSGSAATLNGSNQLVSIGQTGTVVINLNQAGDDNYNSKSESYTFDVVKSNQTITFNALSSVIYSPGLNVDLAGKATTDSPLAISYTVVSGPATISGTELSITGAGAVVIKASQAGDAAWNPATDATQTLTVGKATPMITNFYDLTKNYGDASFTLNASSSSTGSFTYNSSDTSVASIIGNIVTIVGTGTTTLTANQGFDDNYAAVSTTATLIVGVNTQSISFGALTTKTYGDLPYDVSAVGGASSKPVTFSSSDNTIATCTGVNGSIITIIAAGSCTIYANQEGDANYSAANQVSQLLTVNKKELVISGITVPNKVYDGTNAATLNGATLTGKVGSDDVTLTGGTGVFDNKNVGTSKNVTASGFSLTGTKAGNYVISAQPSGLSADIIKRTLTITGATVANKPYDATTTATLNGATLSEVAGSDDVTLDGGIAMFADKNVGMAIPVSVTGYILGGTDKNNYLLSGQPSGLTADITARAITITADAKSKIYGDVDPVFTVQITSGAIQGSDVAGGSLARIIGENVGTYAINQGTYSYGSNYIETFVSKDLTIAKQTITITADTKSKTYGDIDPLFTAQVTSGTIKTGDVATGSMTRVLGENVGTYAINQGTYTYGSNYTETFVSNDLDIGKRTISITADAKSKAYGDVDPAFSAQVTSGTIKTGDVAAGSMTRVSGENVGIYAINQGTYTYGSNYTETFVSKDLTIAKQTITITADTKSKTYGDIDPLFTAQVISGTIKTGDVATGSMSRVPGENVGTYAINQGTYTYGSNYTETFVSKDLTIGKRTITITADAKSKMYGDTDPVFTAQITSGAIQGSDVATGSLSRLTGEAVGTYSINKNTYTYGSNYAETFVNNNLSIQKRAITITADAKNKMYGDADPTLTAQVTSGTIQGSDAASGSLTRAAGENAGTYAINQGTYTYGGNYAETFVTKDLTIAKRNQTITFNALTSKTYIDPDFELTATASSGLPVAYTSSNTAIATITGSTVKIVGVGNASITAKQEGDANYNAATDVTQSLTVTNITPSNLVYTSPVVYVAGKSIKSLNPTVQGGYVTDYSVSPALPVGLSIDHATGIISGTPTATVAASNYTVTASNTEGSATFSLNITVNDPIVTVGVPPANLSYATPLVFVAGKAITALSPSVSGGIATNYTINPALPTGLSINSNTGVISGTPTVVSAESTYLVTASNDDGSTTFSVDITVNDPTITTGVGPSNLSYTTPLVYIEGKAITALSPSIEGGAATNYSVIPALPTGLTIDNTTGVISGTPTSVTSESSYQITARNSYGNTAFEVNITINSGSVTTGVAPANLSYASPAVYAVGTAITPLTSTVSGGAVSSYTVSPALPSGLTLNAVTGSITGTPTAATAVSVYQITATNSYGSTSFDVILTVNAAGGITGIAPSNLSYASPSVYAVGAAITALSPTVTGSVSSYSVSPALPNGLTLDAVTGIITGTPTAVSGATNYTVTASNETGSTSAIISITVNAAGGVTGVAPSNLKYATPVVYSVGSSVSLTPSVTGSVDSYSLNTALPSGLTLNASSGTISGTPTAASAATNYLVTATNATGSTSFTLNIRISEAPVIAGDTNGDGKITFPEIAGDTNGDGKIDETEIAGDKDGDGKITAPEIAGDTNGDGKIDGTEIVGDTNGDGKITAPEIAGDADGDGKITAPEIAGDINGDGKITSPEIVGDTNGDGMIVGTEIAGDTNGDGKITAPEIAGDADGDGKITAPEIAGDINGDGKITAPEIAGDTNGDGKIDGTEIVGDTNGDGKITAPEIAGDADGDGKITAPEIAGDINGDGKITAPEIAGDTNGDGKIDGTEIVGDTNGDGKITAPEIAGDADGDGKITAPEIAGDINGDGKITSPEIVGDTNGDGMIDGTEIAGDTNGDGKITVPEIAGDADGDGKITAPEIAGDINGDGKITAPEIAGDTNGDGKIDGTEIVGDTNGDGKITAPEIAGDADGDGKITDPEIAGDINGDGKITSPEIVGDTNGDGKIDGTEIVGDTNGDGKITAPEIAGDADGDGKITAPEIAGDINGDGKITAPEIAGDTNGDGKIDGTEIAGDKDGDGKITSPEIAGDTNGDGKVDGTEIAGDKDGDGKIISPEIVGDTNGDGKIDGTEIAGDKDGDGKITSPEIAGDTNGDGKVDGTEIAGDKDGDGKIISPEIVGDTNGDGKIDGTEIAGDKDGDGKVTSPEIGGDTNGDGKIDGTEIAGDKDGDGKVTSPEIAGDTNGDGKIDGTEIAGDANGDGKITSPEIAGDTNGDGKVTSPEIVGDTNGDGKIDGTEIAGDSDGDGQITSSDIPAITIDAINNATPIEGCENTNVMFGYSVLTGTPTQYKITFAVSAIAVGIHNIDYTNLPTSSNTGTLSFAIPNGIPDGVYKGTLQFKDEFGIESAAYEFQFVVNVSSDYIVKKFDDVVLCDNSNNRFTAYQWYKDGIAIQGATEQFYCDPAGLVGSYSVEVTTKDGQKIKTCQKPFNSPVKKSVKAYPNPVQINQEVTVQMSGFDNIELKGAKLTVVDMKGNLIHRSNKVEASNSLSLPPVSGVYAGHVVTANGTDYVFKVIVTK
ncbi:MBG domain-containing protein [Paludibacter propionicigenes]|nr:MBG domain-containing protein [Paludibacter propionicigenes]